MFQPELREYANKRPFEPFRILLSSGEKFEVPHPDLIMVGRRSAIVGFADEADDAAYDRTIKVDLLHVVGVEELEVPPPAPINDSNNGES